MCADKKEGVHRVEIFRIRKEGVCAERKGVCENQGPLNMGIY